MTAGLWALGAKLSVSLKYVSPPSGPSGLRDISAALTTDPDSLSRACALQAALTSFHLPLWHRVALDPQLRDAVEFIIVDDGSKEQLVSPFGFAGRFVMPIL